MKGIIALSNKFIFCSIIVMTFNVAKSSDLVSQSDYWSRARKLLGDISPSGRKFVYVFSGQNEKLTDIYLADVNAPDRPTVFSLEGIGNISQIKFGANDNTILITDDMDGKELTRVHMYDFDTSNIRLISPPNSKAEIVEVGGGHLSMKVSSNDSQFFDLWIIDLATLESRILFKNDRYVEFLVDEEHEPRIGKVFKPNGTVSFYDLASSTRIIGLDSNFEDSNAVKFLKYSRANKLYYFLDNRSGTHQELKSYNPSSQKFSTIFSTFRSEIVDLVWDAPSDRPIAVSVEKDKRYWYLLDGPAISQVFNNWHLNLRVIARDRDANKILAELSSDTQSGEIAVIHYDFDMNTKIVGTSISNEFNKGVAPSSPTTSFSFNARDGLEIFGYFNPPTHTVTTGSFSPAPPPGVLLVHGGPWDRDRWDYNPVVQWLANRGYGVLRVNYRGSTGYGSDFKKLANGNWGGDMQNDLIDAVDWAIKKNLIDGNRVGIMGTSYGGYAVLSALTTYPHKFKAGINLMGISNLETILKSLPSTWTPEIEKYYKLIGDPRTDKGSAFLRDRSPVYFADRVAAPLLIGQGKNDPRVPIAESNQMVHSLEAKGKDLIYVVFDNEGHGLRHPENQTAFYLLAENFLAKYLGGRAQTFIRPKKTTMVIASGIEIFSDITNTCNKAFEGPLTTPKTKSQIQ